MFLARGSSTPCQHIVSHGGLSCDGISHKSEKGRLLKCSRYYTKVQMLLRSRYGRQEVMYCYKLYRTFYNLLKVIYQNLSPRKHCIEYITPELIRHYKVRIYLRFHPRPPSRPKPYRPLPTTSQTGPHLSQTSHLQHLA
jgi:hypothetical protein